MRAGQRAATWRCWPLVVSSPCPAHPPGDARVTWYIVTLSPRSQGLTEFCCCRRCAAVAPPCCMQLSCCYRVLALTVAITHSPSASGCCDQRSLPSLSSLRPRRARQMWATAPGVLTTVLSAGDAPVVIWRQGLSLPAPASVVSTHLPDHSVGRRQLLCGSG